MDLDDFLRRAGAIVPDGPTYDRTAVCRSCGKEYPFRTNRPPDVALPLGADICPQCEDKEYGGIE